MIHFKKISLITAGILILGLLFVMLFVNISSIRPRIAIPQSQLDSLISLQARASQLGEYPVSALVIYKGRIIGSGINTFRTSTEPLGHAEINAIEDAFEKMHYSVFRTLSRDSLVLVTSYEPCSMCKGVINQLDIRKVYYLQPKGVRSRFQYLRKELSFVLKTRQIKVPEDQ